MIVIMREREKIQVFNWKDCPNKRRSIKNFEKIFMQVNNDSYIGHFMRVQYKLKKEEKEFVLQIYQPNIEIEERKEYPDSFLKKLTKHSEEKQTFICFNNIKLKKFKRK